MQIPIPCKYYFPICIINSYHIVIIFVISVIIFMIIILLKLFYLFIFSPLVQRLWVF